MSNTQDDRFLGLPIAMLELDGGQRIRECDASFCALFDCTPADVIGFPIDDLFNPRDRRGSLEFATKMNRGSDGLIDVLITLRIRGRDHLARLRLVRRSDGYTCLVDRLHGNDDLALRLVSIEQRWKGLVRSSEEGIVTLDTRGRIVEHNAMFFSLMGFRDARGVSLSEDAVVGRMLVDLVGTAVPGLVEYLESPEGDFLARTEGATCLEVKGRSIELPNRERIGTLLLVRDIEEELQIQQRDAIIRNDLMQARAFQRMILSEPPTLPAHDIEVVYRPLDQVGGDIYDVVRLPDGRVRAFIADATGHGVAAALATMLIKSAYENVKLSDSPPADVLAALNDQVAISYRSHDAMFTAMIADLSLDTREIEYATAAHPPALLVHEDKTTELETGGTFMGVASGKTFPRWRRTIPRNTGLYFVTDGILEARCPNGELFGDTQLERALIDANRLPSGVGQALLARLNSWLRPATPDDDITIISVRFDRPPGHAPRG